MDQSSLLNVAPLPIFYRGYHKSLFDKSVATLRLDPD